jgi:hypothetical protein
MKLNLLQLRQPIFCSIQLLSIRHMLMDLDAKITVTTVVGEDITPKDYCNKMWLSVQIKP